MVTGEPLPEGWDERLDAVVEWAAEHDINACPECRAYIAAVDAGADPQAVGDMRCIQATARLRGLFGGEDL